MTTDPKGPFSNFTLNANRGGGAKAPTLRGAITVIDIDGKPVEFEHAAWGPNAAADGKREYYGIVITPKDPALAARQKQMEHGNLPMPTVPNAVAGLQLDAIGRGVLFETTAEEKAAAIAAGKKVRTYFGSALVLLPSGPKAIDLAAREVVGHNFHSGWANLHDPKAAADAKSKRPPTDAPRADRKAKHG